MNPSIPQKRRKRKTLEEKQEELKRKILQDGKDWESWHLDQNVTPRHLPMGAILNPLNFTKEQGRGKYHPSEKPACTGSGWGFTTNLREFYREEKMQVKCPTCFRLIRVRLDNEALFTKEYAEVHPAEQVYAHVVFHRIERSKRKSER
jgi:hypothetical protein